MKRKQQILILVQPGVLKCWSAAVGWSSESYKAELPISSFSFDDPILGFYFLRREERKEGRKGILQLT